MKKLLTLIIMVLAVALAMAQAPENFSFQAVVRNANNSLVANAQVGVRVNILQGSATGDAVYSESHVTSSNANGLVTVNIGGGSVLHGSFEGIDWSDGPYFLKTDIDPNGGNDYSITSTQQLLSVPYALYAKEAGNSFSGDYNDLTNTPQIPTVPTNVSTFTNDAGYITGYTETDPQFTAWDKDYNDLINKPAIPAVPTNVSAFTNDAGYITSAAIPAIPTVPTNVSAFTNDAGYITAAQVPAQVNADWNATSGAAQILNKPALFSGNYNDLTNKPVLFSGNYNDLTNKPTLFDGNYNSLTNRPNLAAVATSGNYNDLINKPAIPMAVGELTNNVGYITQAQVPAQVNADWNATSGAAQILNKPTLFSGNYNDLTNKPVLFSGDYNDLTNLPQIPQIPADISAFNNDAGYLTSYTETDPQFNAWDKNYNDLTNKPTIPTVPTNVSAFTNDAGYITAQDIPAIPTVPTNVSAFTNDAGYVTANDIPAYQVLSISNDTIYLSNGGYAVLPPGFDGDYNSLTNRPNLFSGSYNDLTDTPAIPTVPTNVSAFTNDAGYLTEYTEQQVLSISNDTLFLTGGSFVKLPAGFSGDYNDLTNLPQIPQIPADISAFTNDAGYITGYTETDPQFNAWDKDYNDLINKPAIPAVPTNVSAFTNDAGYITAANVQEAANIPTNVSAFNNDAGYITSEDIPEIPTVPTNVGAFTNDAGYLTNYTETDPEFNAWDKNYNDLTNKPTLFSGNYNDLTNKPTLFDGNYNSLFNKPNLATVATTGNYNDLINKPALFSGNYNDLTNKPTIPAVNNATLTIQRNGSNVGTFTANQNTNQTVNITVPTTTSQLTNNSGYITSADIPSIPTNVSQLNNDAGYITAAQCGDVDICAMANQLAQLQQQMSQMQARLDSLEGNTTFTCGTSTVTDHEGNVYATVQIGDQCWMRDNLRTTTSPSTGTYLIPASGTGYTYTGKQARWYNNDSATYAPMNYGLLYNWNAAVDTFNTTYGETSVNSNSSNAVSVTFTGHRRGICPAGWHLPSDAEWNTMEATVSGSDWQTSYETSTGYRGNHAGKLAGGDNWSSSTTSGAPGDYSNADRNVSGFSAVPAGSCYGSSFDYAGYGASFWSSTQYDSYIAWYRYLGFYNAGVTRYYGPKYPGFSVRCLRDSGGGDGSSATLPTVITNTVSNITPTTATSGGNIIADGGASVTARGICWSTSQNPTVGDSNTTDGSGTGSFSSSISGLTANTTYYVRAYATNSVGTAYGEEVTFTTLSAGGTAVIDSKSCPGTPTVTDHEGNVYATVQIGDQCWMRDNLRTTTSPSTGTYLIPPADADYTYTGKQARWFNNDSATYAPMNYGLLYNWNAAVDTFNTTYGETSVNTSSSNAVSVTFSGHRRGICPAGWHLPSDAEWTAMEQTQTSMDVTGTGWRGDHAGKLAGEGWSSSTTAGAPGNASDPAHNASGFSAVPAGGCAGSSFGDAGSHANFWSSSHYGSNGAYARRLGYYDARVNRGSLNKLYGRSVRCLRDSGGGDGSSATLPTVTTNTVSNITPTTATSGGNITSDGGASVTARGVCWSTSQNPTVNGSHTADGSGMGSFSSSISGLTANTTYYVRAYATNSAGTAYGETVAFTTLSAGGTATIDAKSCPGTSTVTDHEGNVYATVQIGDQCWMRDNLRTTTSPSTGTYLIPAANANYTYTGKQARWYNNDSATYAPMNYGLLYNWNAAVDTFNTAYGETSVNSNSSNAVSVTFNGHRRGICPAGWHLPSDAEWTTLTDYVSSQSEFQCGGNSNYIAKALASTEGWNTSTNNCVVGNDQASNNATGFGALPAGVYGTDYNFFGRYANFWSATEVSSGRAFGRNLSSHNSSVNRGNLDKYHGYSVRCLRDSAVTAGETPVQPDTTSNPTTDTPVDAQPCPGAPTVTDHDGNVYNTVQIGEQCWMKENLRTTHYADGTDILIESGYSNSVPYRYYPDDNANNVPTYGYLYNWPAVMYGAVSSNTNPSGVQGICPNGWHVPSNAEWTQLTVYVSRQSEYTCGGDSLHIAKALASTIGWISSTYTCAVGNTQASNNSTGFGAVPAGYYYDGFGYSANFWSCTEDGSSSAYPRCLDYCGFYVYNGSWPKSYGYSVRCLKDMDSSLDSLTEQVQDTIAPVIDLPHHFIRLWPIHGGNNTWNFPDRQTLVDSIYPYISDNYDEKDSLLQSIQFFWENTTESPIGEANIFRQYNHLSVMVKITDRSGNSTEQVVFIIDRPDDNIPPVDAQPCFGMPTIVDYDGNVYNTVQIGDQCWMKENLRARHYFDGTEIPLNTDTSSTFAFRHYPGNDSSKVVTYGFLYNWSAVMNGEFSSSTNPSRVRGICPTGWHVPSDSEWTQLRNYVISVPGYWCNSDSTMISKSLASTSLWANYNTECSVGYDKSLNNSTGFSAIPADAYGRHSYYYIGLNAFFWSSTQCNEETSYYRIIGYHHTGFSKFGINGYKSYGYSVRCLRDAPSSPNPDQPTVPSDTTTPTDTPVDAQPCPGAPTVTDHEGNIYNTVQIGEQCWMAENLRTTTSPSTGTYLIPPAGTTYTYSGKQARWYNDDSVRYAPLGCGLLYNWNAAVDTFNTAYGETSVNTNSNNAVSVTFNGHRRGICPAGWHLPSDAEWTTLTDYVSSQSEFQCGGNSNYIAKALASTEGWNTSTNNCVVGNDPSTNNATGFSAVPAGLCSGSSFYSAGYGAYFWSSAQSRSDYAYCRDLGYTNAYVGRDDYHKGYGRSVRCLRD